MPELGQNTHAMPTTQRKKNDQQKERIIQTQEAKNILTQLRMVQNTFRDTPRVNHPFISFRLLAFHYGG